MREKGAKTKRNQILLDLTSDILKKCKKENIEIRVLGGIAVYLRCPKYHNFFHNFREPFSDIDLITRKEHIEKIETFFNSLGFEQNKNIKILFGYQRRIFYTCQNITIEVYLDNLEFSQTIKISERLLLDYPTLSVTDLFLSRIQRIDLQDKDVFDISVLLDSFNLSNKDNNQIDIDYISKLCSKNWRWWKTLKINIDKLLRQKKNIFKSPNNINTKLREIENAIDAKKKSLRWRLRNIIGEKIRWFNSVENKL